MARRKAMTDLCLATILPALVDTIGAFKFRRAIFMI